MKIEPMEKVGTRGHDPRDRRKSAKGGSAQRAFSSFFKKELEKITQKAGE